MNDSTFSEEDRILGAFVLQLSKATDDSAKQRIVLRYIAQHPHLKEEFLRLPCMEKVLERSHQSDEIPEIPREFGEFVIIRRIGGAGMGEIYEAYHENLDRRVAIKIIRRGWTSDEAKQRFDRERLVLAKLHQTHIVPIHTAGEHDGVQYFVMPYIEGASLNFVVQAAREHHSTHSAQNTPSVGRFAEHAVSLMKSGESETAYRSASEKSATRSGVNGNGAVSELTLPIPFSKEYHSSVAKAIADVADAVGYAHDAGILHRDLKPHNIMIEPNGHIWVIDFGLAGFLKRDSDTAPVAGEHADSAKTAPSFDEHPQLTQGAGGGTPSYMAPERWKGGPTTEQSDVWALGATLYELLTLHQAFKGPGEKLIRQRILKETPRAAKEFVKGLPADLAAICRKAMERDPGQRYQTAADLARDLRRWLNHEPTTALPSRAPRRALLWSRRNPGWASLLGATVVMAIVFGVMEAKIIAANNSLIAANNNAIAAKEKEIEAKTAAIKADAKVIVAKNQEIKTRDRQLEIREIERMQFSTHAIGWSEEIWNFGAKLEGDSDVREVLATSLIDFDAAELYNDLTTAADFLAFDELGERLACGGSTDEEGTLLQPPKVLDLKTQKWHESTINRSGPVAFRKDQVPVVLVPDPENARRVRMFDINTSQEIASFVAEGPVVKLTNDNHPILALSPDATFAVIATLGENSDEDDPNKEFDVSVWDTSTSERIHKCLVVGASSLAITRDGSILAIGQETGQVGLWSIGNAVQFTSFQLSGSPVLSLAFAKDYLRRLPSDNAAVTGAGWLLASGDQAGGLIVWDVTLRKPRAEMRGSYHETLSLAFSYDSSLLFSVGRTPGRIWDIATGEQILTWRSSSYMPAIAVTSNGLLASARKSTFGSGSGIQVHKLLNDRGGIVLRGLRDAVRRLKVSDDGSLIAGLTMTWQIGVWKSDGTLLHVFDAPVGPFADNAAMAFSPDNRSLFSCTGNRALTWDLDTGAISRTWDVAPALVNESAYSPDGKHLYLARKEVEVGSRYPLSDAPTDRFPRVVRAYDLLLDNVSEKPIFEFEGIARRAYRIQVGRNGLLVICGGKTVSPRTSETECWDLTTGKMLWSLPYDHTGDCWVNLSPDGNHLLLLPNELGPPEILDTRTAAVLKERQNIYACDDKVQYSVATSRISGPDRDGGVRTDDRYVVVCPAGDPNPLVSFFFEAAQVFDAQFFEHQQRIHLAWTNDRGHIAVVDLETIRTRLETVGLGWELPDSDQ